jgi:fructokinase
MKEVFGAIEAGGTKFVCAVGTNPNELYDEIRFPTTTPKETIQHCIEYFKMQQGKYLLKSVGIGSFGPLDLRKDSPTFGFITKTNKTGWTNTNFLGVLKKELNIPIEIDTDVNAAALGEYYWGAGKGFNDFLYLTIGTGIGGGAIVNGKLLHGFNHPEMGHILIPHNKDDDNICNFHNDCLEGFASGPAIENLWKQKAESLPPEHIAWNNEVDYIAKAVVNYMLILAPKRIIIGGGVMEQKHLFPMIREKVKKYLNGYIHLPEIINNLGEYIVPPELGNKAGILGAIALAKLSYNN